MRCIGGNEEHVKEVDNDDTAAQDDLDIKWWLSGNYKLSLAGFPVLKLHANTELSPIVLMDIIPCATTEVAKSYKSKHAGI